MAGSDEGVANVLGIQAVEHHRFKRRAGRYEAPVLAAMRKWLPCESGLPRCLKSKIILCVSGLFPNGASG